MAWLRAADTEVKRDMEISRDEVRVMTVHGAKGLEASVVFLVDTATSPSDSQRPKLIRLPQGNAAPHAPVSWYGPAERPTIRPTLSGARGDAGRYRGRIPEAAVCGHDARRRPADRRRLHARQHGQGAPVPPGTIRSTRASTIPGLQLQELKTALGLVKRYSRPEDLPRRRQRRRRRTTAPIVLPSWLQTSAPSEASGREPVAPRPIPRRWRRHPVRTAELIDVARKRLAARHAGAPAAAIAARYRARTPPRSRAVVSRPQRRRLDRGRAAGAGGRPLALIADPRFAPAFAPGSRAEVSIVGRLDRAGGQPRWFPGRSTGWWSLKRGSDRRLQDQSCPAEPLAEAPAGLYPPARALPGGAREALSPEAGPRRAALDRNA